MALRKHHLRLALVLLSAFSALQSYAAPGKIGPASAQKCLDVQEIEWKSVPGKILLNGVHFKIKGVNWFGLELVNKVMGGLNYVSIEDVLDFCVEHSFNAIRLPFSLAFALSDEDSTFPKPKFVSEDLEGITTWKLVDRLFKEAGKRGIFILLDLHALDPNKGFSELWYDEDNSEKEVLHGWYYMLERYGKYWNLLGVDIKNECHDSCSWGKGDDDTDFNRFVERMMLYTRKHFPQFKGLFFVEGIHVNAYGRPPSAYKYWWGGNLYGAEKFPIKTGISSLDDRVVYSPHIYGPDVYLMDYFEATEFPRNLDGIWTEQFGWLIDTLQKAVVVGEWGGSCKGKDGITQDHLANWMIDNCITDNFWWALNPGSEDTDGLMNNNWSRYEPVKMELLDRVQPDPTLVSYSKRTESICITPGTSANHKCDATTPPGGLRPVPPPTPPQQQQPPAPASTPKLRGVEVGIAGEQMATKEEVPLEKKKAVVVEQEEEEDEEEEEEDEDER